MADPTGPPDPEKENPGGLRLGDGIDWGWRGHSGQSEFHDSLVRAVARHVQRRSQVLEVGVGAGYLLATLAAAWDCRCVGVDILPQALEASRETAANRGVELRLVLGSGFGLPFPDGAFDVVMSHGVIEHFPERQARSMLTEHARVCRRGGLVIVSVPNSLDLVHSVRRSLLGRRYAFFPERSYSRWSLSRELHNVGLRPETADGYAPFWSLRQSGLAYPLVWVLHRTGLLDAVGRVSNPTLLSVFGNLTLVVARRT